MTTSLKTTPDGCVEIVVVKDGFTEIGWVSSMHLVTGKELQLLRVIERKAAAIYGDISELEREAMISDGATDALPPFVVPPIHDA